MLIADSLVKVTFKDRLSVCVYHDAMIRQYVLDPGSRAGQWVKTVLRSPVGCSRIFWILLDDSARPDHFSKTKRMHGWDVLDKRGCTLISINNFRFCQFSLVLSGNHFQSGCGWKPSTLGVSKPNGQFEHRSKCIVTAAGAQINLVVCFLISSVDRMDCRRSHSSRGDQCIKSVHPGDCAGNPGGQQDCSEWVFVRYANGHRLMLVCSSTKNRLVFSSFLLLFCSSPVSEFLELLTSYQRSFLWVSTDMYSLVPLICIVQTYITIVCTYCTGSADSIQ